MKDSLQSYMNVFIFSVFKMWIMDLPDGAARLLRLRDGHSAPPTNIEFFSKNGHSIVSAGMC